jgi:hypothetical protein
MNSICTTPRPNDNRLCEAVDLYLQSEGTLTYQQVSQVIFDTNSKADSIRKWVNMAKTGTRLASAPPLPPTITCVDPWHTTPSQSKRVKRAGHDYFVWLPCGPQTCPTCKGIQKEIPQVKIEPYHELRPEAVTQTDVKELLETYPPAAYASGSRANDDPDCESSTSPHTNPMYPSNWVEDGLIEGLDAGASVATAANVTSQERASYGLRVTKIDETIIYPIGGCWVSSSDEKKNFRKKKLKKDRKEGTN